MLGPEVDEFGLKVPMIIRIQQGAKPVLPDPPTWERWPDRMRVFNMRDWSWWRRRLFFLTGSPRWLPVRK